MPVIESVRTTPTKPATDAHRLILGRSGTGKTTILAGLVVAALTTGSTRVLLVNAEPVLAELPGVTVPGTHRGAPATATVKMLHRLLAEIKGRATYLACEGREDLPAGTPRVLVAIDDYQQFFRRESNSVSEELKGLLTAVLVGGEQVGVRVVLASQRAGVDVLPAEAAGLFSTKTLFRVLG